MEKEILKEMDLFENDDETENKNENENNENESESSDKNQEQNSESETPRFGGGIAGEIGVHGFWISGRAYRSGCLVWVPRATDLGSRDALTGTKEKI